MNRRVLSKTLGERTPLYRVIDSFLRHLELLHAAISDIPDFLDPRCTGIVRIYRHPASPIEEFNSWRKLRSPILTIRDLVEHLRFLLRFRREKIGMIMQLHFFIEPSDATGVNRGYLRILA